MQTAEEFADTLDRECITCEGRCWADEVATALIEARDNVTRLAAKLELLEEIRAYVVACPGSGDKRYEALLAHLEAKYTQPVQLTKGEK